MTIVFWDISSFSVLCYNLDKQPIIVTDFLRDYLEVAIKCIHDHRGIVDKSIGDGILSFFGFDNEDKKSDAHDAITAALELRQRFENIKRKWIEIWSKDLGNGKISLAIAISIAAGLLYGFTHSLILTPTLAALGWIVSDSVVFGNSLLVRKFYSKN